MRAEDIEAVESSETSLAPAAMRPSVQEKPGHTRTSGAWTLIALALSAVVVVLVFAIQNLSPVEVTFLSFHWTPPLAVLLLFASTLGALVVFAFGAARISQLRIQARRLRRAR